MLFQEFSGQSYIWLWVWYVWCKAGSIPQSCLTRLPPPLAQSVLSGGRNTSKQSSSELPVSEASHSPLASGKPRWAEFNPWTSVRLDTSVFSCLRCRLAHHRSPPADLLKLPLSGLLAYWRRCSRSSTKPGKILSFYQHPHVGLQVVLTSAWLWLCCLRGAQGNNYSHVSSGHAAVQQREGHSSSLLDLINLKASFSSSFVDSCCSVECICKVKLHFFSVFEVNLYLRVPIYLLWAGMAYVDITWKLQVGLIESKSSCCSRHIQGTRSMSVFNCYDGLFAMLMPFFLSAVSINNLSPISCRGNEKYFFQDSLSSNFKTILNFDVSLNLSLLLGTWTAKQTPVHSVGRRP